MFLLELHGKLISRETILVEVREVKASSEQVHARSKAILNSVFPAAVADELHRTGQVEPKFFDLATVMFVDFKDSTLLIEGMEPARLIEHLIGNFATIDEIGDANRVLTLRTVGDGSLCVVGIAETNRTHPVDMCLMALQLQRSIGKKKSPARVDAPQALADTRRHQYRRGSSGCCWRKTLYLR